MDNELHLKNNTFETINDISIDNLVIWALRSCILQRNCQGMQQLFRDWFGKYNNEFLQHSQILVWANHNNWQCNLKFQPFSGLSHRKEEELVLIAINAINNKNSEKALEISKFLAGNLYDFAYASLKNMAKIIEKTQLKIVN